MNPEFNKEIKKVMEHIKQRNSGDGTHIFDAEKINAQLELINQIEAGVYNKAIDDAINVVNDCLLDDGEDAYVKHELLRLKKIDKP